MIRRRAKYAAVPTIVDGIRFASQREARRYRELTILARAGVIRDLERQPEYPLVVNGVRVARYLADFRYVETSDGRSVVEDVKGVRTPVYTLKKKLVAALYGVAIVEV